MLSNFSECRIVCGVFIEDGNGGFVEKEYVFPSSESLWWAHFMFRECDISRLAVGGDLSTVEGLEVILGKSVEMESKKQLYEKKKTREMDARFWEDCNGHTVTFSGCRVLGEMPDLRCKVSKDTRVTP